MSRSLVSDLAKVSATIAIAALALTGNSQAATIDFGSYATAGSLFSNPLVTPFATFSSTDVLQSEFSFLSTGGSICALVVSTGYCNADFTVDFSSPVSGLSFETDGWDSGDSITVTAYDGSNALSPTTLILANAVFDLSSLGTITRLLFDDNSAVSGVAYGNFSFDVQLNPCRGNTCNTVPIPAALPLLASGLGALGFLGWRRKRKEKLAAA